MIIEKPRCNVFDSLTTVYDQIIDDWLAQPRCHDRHLQTLIGCMSALLAMLELRILWWPKDEKTCSSKAQIVRAKRSQDVF